MVPMPDYLIEEVRMTIILGRELAFASTTDDVVAYADFCIKVVAETDGGEWSIDEIWMGEKRLSGKSFGWAHDHFHKVIGSDIAAHVAEHLPGILADAKADSEREANR